MILIIIVALIIIYYSYKLQYTGSVLHLFVLPSPLWWNAYNQLLIFNYHRLSSAETGYGKATPTYKPDNITERVSGIHASVHTQLTLCPLNCLLCLPPPVFLHIQPPGAAPTMLTIDALHIQTLIKCSKIFTRNWITIFLLWSCSVIPF